MIFKAKDRDEIYREWKKWKLFLSECINNNKNSACQRESLEYSVSQKLPDKSVLRCWEALTMSYAPKSSRKFITKVHYLKLVKCRSWPILEEKCSCRLGIETWDKDDRNELQYQWKRMCSFCSKFVVNLPMKRQMLGVWAELLQGKNQRVRDYYVLTYF